MKHKAQFIVDLILIVSLITIAVMFVAMTVKVNKAEKRDKIEQAIIEELKLQATDYGADGDEYVVFLFPASASYTEETDGKGKYYLALIVGSGTDDDGEWMFVEYYNGEIMTYHYRIVDFYRE
jgi:hypothetical protein